MVKEMDKKRYISRTIIGVVILGLSITVIMQHRRINALTSGSKSSNSQDENAECNAEIERLKTQIDDMQEWQDYLEGALNENNKRTVSAPQNRTAGNRNIIAENAPNIINNPTIRAGIRSAFSSRYDALAEEIGLSDEKKSQLMGLFDEMRQEIMSRMPARGEFPPEMMDREAIRQQIEEINQKYNEKLSEILSDDELYAFREYQSSETERMLIMGFNMLSEGGSQLDEDKEKELVAALYSARQNNPDTKRETDTLSLMGGPMDRGPINETVENADKLNSIYIESARNILSEDEMKKFENYLTSRQSPFNMRGGPPPDRFRAPE